MVFKDKQGKRENDTCISTIRKNWLACI
jgi:hypothetical protein